MIWWHRLEQNSKEHRQGNAASWQPFDKHFEGTIGFRVSAAPREPALGLAKLQRELDFL